VTKTRRKVDPTDRLSEQMIEVLRWAHDNHMGDPQKFVPWKPSALIGENPSPSKSNALSTSLKRLEERGLLVRYSITYRDNIITRLVWAHVAESRIRTTHLQLTRAGFRFVESLSHDDIDIEKEEIDRERRKLERRAENLRFAFTLLHREKLKLMIENDPSSQILTTNLDAINKSLEELSKAELGRKTGDARYAVNETLLELNNKLKDES